MRIDAHHHLWQLARGDYGWLTPDPSLAPIYRDFTMADVTPLLKRFSIDKTILVQAAPTEAETQYLLGIALHDARVAGVVGWSDFESPTARENIARLAVDPLLLGLRPMVQDIADDDWLLREDLHPAFQAMEKQKLVFDALVLPRHLTRLLHVVDQFPGITFVIDHLAKPFVALGAMEPWASEMSALARRPNVFCKLSGLITEAKQNWRIDDLRPYVQHVLRIFTPQRLLWGSDWPVADLAGGYRLWGEASEDLLGHLSQQDRDAIWGGTAAKVYLSRRGRQPS
ncbi:amidohydrolase family protein [Lacibacterium aquatile]|uniref:Amidohydrolase family protein n=1 Tax=Lacibacterium aquatile TaxID=1168082 RepID=A0ABW5DKH2_9PROT